MRVFNMIWEIVFGLLCEFLKLSKPKKKYKLNFGTFRDPKKIYQIDLQDTICFRIETSMMAMLTISQAMESYI